MHYNFNLVLKTFFPKTSQIRELNFTEVKSLQINNNIKAIIMTFIVKWIQTQEDRTSMCVVLPLYHVSFKDIFAQVYK